jgi:hypothetical protein
MGRGIVDWIRVVQDEILRWDFASIKTETLGYIQGGKFLRQKSDFEVICVLEFLLLDLFVFQ